MTFAAVGSAIKIDASGQNVSPVNVGDLIVMVFITFSSTQFVNGVSGGNCTWTQAGTTYNGVNVAFSSTLWFGKATGTGAAALTLTLNSGTPTIRGLGNEFSSTVGSWALDVQGNIDSTISTLNCPALTPAAAGELYFAFGPNGGVAGSTSGYTYIQDNHGNEGCFNPNCSAATQQPTFGTGGGGQFAAGLMVRETPAAGPAGTVQPPLRGPRAAAKGKLASILIKPPTVGGPPAPFFPPRVLLRGAAAAVKGKPAGARGQPGRPSPFRLPGPLKGPAATRPGKLTGIIAPPPVLHPVITAAFKPPPGLLRPPPPQARSGQLTGTRGQPGKPSPFTAPRSPLRGLPAARKGTLARIVAPPPVIHPNVPAPFFPPRTLLRGPAPIQARTLLTGAVAPPPVPPPPVTSPHWQGSTHMPAAGASGNLILGANHTGTGGPGDLKGDYERSGD